MDRISGTAPASPTPGETKAANRGPFSGYYGNAEQDPDEELTHVLPRTPGGEYLRRFWQPVALKSQLGDMPLNVKILGEELVLFRTTKGQVGLLHRQCAHRGASLEYGRVEDCGIRCCYHGWLFGTDGSILETPAEPQSSTLRNRLWQGAYPTHEFAGLIFAYLGPPQAIPGFPIIDNFQIPGATVIPYARHYACNWLQIAENSFDSAHVAFLHINHSKPQFSEERGVVPTLSYYRRKIGLYHAQARRIGDHVWVSSKDILFPNVTQAGTVFSVTGEEPRYFGRSAFTRWVVPHDNHSATVFGVAHHSDRGDPYKPEYAAKEHFEILEAGTPTGRPYAERQRYPGDDEAIVSQGPIAVHAKEHLASTDAGVALYRRQLRKAIRSLRDGIEPPTQTAEGDLVRTYGGCTVLHIPNAPERASVSFLKQLSDEVVAIYVEGDKVDSDQRYALIEGKLRQLEQAHSS